jgi:hypothetical protein
MDDGRMKEQLAYAGHMDVQSNNKYASAPLGLELHLGQSNLKPILAHKYTNGPMLHYLSEYHSKFRYLSLRMSRAMHARYMTAETHFSMYRTLLTQMLRNLNPSPPIRTPLILIDIKSCSEGHTQVYSDKYLYLPRRPFNRHTRWTPIAQGMPRSHPQACGCHGVLRNQTLRVVATITEA